MVRLKSEFINSIPQKYFWLSNLIRSLNHWLLKFFITIFSGWLKSAHFLGVIALEKIKDSINSMPQKYFWLSNLIRSPNHWLLKCFITIFSGWLISVIDLNLHTDLIWTDRLFFIHSLVSKCNQNGTITNSINIICQHFIEKQKVFTRILINRNNDQN